MSEKQPARRCGLRSHRGAPAAAPFPDGSCDPSGSAFRQSRNADRLVVPQKNIALLACSFFFTTSHAPPCCTRRRRRSALRLAGFLLPLCSAYPPPKCFRETFRETFLCFCVYMRAGALVLRVPACACVLREEKSKNPPAATPTTNFFQIICPDGQEFADRIAY